MTGLSIRLAMTAVAAMAVTPAAAATITIKSDATTESAATDLATAAAPPSGSLVFTPVIEDAQGTFTPLPTGSPAGTEVVNIAPGGGQSGFFRSQFTLPVGYTNASITGRANIDDGGTIYLNGTAIGTATEFGDQAFSSSLAGLFAVGTNYLYLSDVNSGGGPSGAAFWATISYDAVAAPGVPEPASWALMLAGFGAMGWAMRRRPRTAVRVRFA